MPGNPVPGTVFNVWKNRLSDSNTGLNPNLRSVLGAGSYQIDFGGVSGNFIQGDFANFRDIEAGANVNYPMLLMDIMDISDARSVRYLKFHKFAGTMMGVCKIILEYKKLDAIQDFTTLAHGTVEAMLLTMNSTALQQPVVYPNGVVYNGDIIAKISPVTKGGVAWLRLVTFTCSFNFATQQ